METVKRRRCGRCGVSYPRTEGYFFGVRRADGSLRLSLWCKRCDTDDLLPMFGRDATEPQVKEACERG